MTDAHEPDAPEERRKPPRRWPVILGLVALVLVALVGGGAWMVQNQLAGQVSSLPSAMPTNTDRPTLAPDTDQDAQTILLLGSDKRDNGAGGGERSDTMMLVRIAADRKSVSLVSIPRDSWVKVPGHGKAKINAAFAWDGPALAVQTVEQLSGVRIDHVAVIDWEGFKRLTDALGGVTVTIPQTTFDSYRKQEWKAGTHRLDGEQALTYVRQRAGLPGGDLDRVKRQQNVIRELMSQTLSKGTMTNPVTVYRVLDAITDNLEVDEGWLTGDMRSLALSLRSVRGSDVRFSTVPVAGTGTEGDQSVVHLDRENADRMWAAFKKDAVAEWIDDMNRGLSTTVR